MTGPGEFLTYKEVTRLCKVSRKTIARWVKDGKFPKPIDMNGEVRWVASEVWMYLAKMMADREGGVELMQHESGSASLGKESDGSEGDRTGLSGTSAPEAAKPARQNKNPR